MALVVDTASSLLQSRLATAVGRLALENHGDTAQPATMMNVRNWRTLLNHVVEVRDGTEGADVTIFFKISRDDADKEALASEWRHTTAFRRYFDTTRPALDSVEPIAYYPDVGVMAVRGCGRDTLSEAVRRSCRWTARPAMLRSAAMAVHGAGRWLRHLETTSAGAASSFHARALMLQAAEAAERKIQSGDVVSRFARLASMCREDLRLVPEQSPVPVYMAHGDFHPGNVFVSGGAPSRVTAIDLCLAAPRFRGYDAIYFEHEVLSSMPPERFDRRKVRFLLDEFWRGYGGRPDRTCPVVRGMKAHFVLCGLVYLSTLARDASVLRKGICYLDARRLASCFTV